MKKTIAIIVALVLVACMAIPAMAADDNYVPSIEMKNPEIVAPETLDGVYLGGGKEEDVKAVLNEADGTKTAVFEISTLTIEDAYKNESGDVEKTLIDAYENFESKAEDVAAEIGINAEDQLVIAMFDVTVVNADHNTTLEAANTTIVIRFSNEFVGAEDGKLAVVHMVDGAWEAAESVKVEGDVIVVEFSQLCPIAFVAEKEAIGDESESSETTETETESETESETETETGSESVTESETATESETETESAPVGGSEVESNPSESESGSDEPETSEPEESDDKKPSGDKDKDDKKEDEEDNSVMIATIVIVSVTVVVIAGIVVFYVLEKKGVLNKSNKNNSNKKKY